MRFEITAPDPGYTGVAYGVAFVDGVAWATGSLDDPPLKALAVNGFKVVDRDAGPASAAANDSAEPEKPVPSPPRKRVPVPAAPEKSGE